MNKLFPGVDSTGLFGDWSSKSDRSVPSQAHYESCEHPRMPGQPYIATTSGTASFTTSTGASIALGPASTAGLAEIRYWKDTVPKLPAKASKAQKYHWHERFSKFCHSKGIFVPPFADILRDFDYRAMLPGILHSHLIDWSSQLYQLLSCYTLDQEDEDIVALIATYTCGFELIAGVLGDVHPHLDPLMEAPSKRFEPEKRGESFLQFAQRAIMDISYGETWTADTYADFIIDHLYGAATREKMKHHKREELNSNDPMVPRRWTTPELCQLRLKDLLSKARSAPSSSGGSFRRNIHSIHAEPTTPDSDSEDCLIDVHSVSDVAQLDIASIGELLSMEGLDDSLTAHVYSLVEQNQTSIPENLLSEECAVCGRHKDTSKCNHLISHLLRKELFEKYPALAARLNVLMRQRYEKILGTRSNLGKQDFRRGGI